MFSLSLFEFIFRKIQLIFNGLLIGDSIRLNRIRRMSIEFQIVSVYESVLMWMIRISFIFPCYGGKFESNWQICVQIIVLLMSNRKYSVECFVWKCLCRCKIPLPNACYPIFFAKWKPNRIAKSESILLPEYHWKCASFFAWNIFYAISHFVFFFLDRKHFRRFGFIPKCWQQEDKNDGFQWCRIDQRENSSENCTQAKNWRAKIK